MTEITVSGFVMPSAQTALGGALGLELHHIARSLSIHFKDAKKKLLDGGMLDRMEAQGFGWAEFASQQEIQEVSGHKYIRDVESYVLDVNAAKFFVAKYNNAIGDAYLARLLQFEADSRPVVEDRKDLTNPAAVSNFIAPTPREELGGELGLDLHPIAKSLGAEFKHLKERYLTLKNLNEIDGVAITASSGNPINPTVESFVLTVEDAKFLVTQYQNKIGRAYCKYLIRFEEKAKPVVEAMLNDPANMIAVLQAYQAEKEGRAVDRKRAFSAMGTAGTFRVTNNSVERSLS